VTALSIRHRHGHHVHSHPYSDEHRHLLSPRKSALVEDRHRRDHDHEHHDHGHSHGLIDPSIVRSHAGIRAVAWSLLVLGATAAIQVAIYALSGSVALLADLIRSGRAERWAGLAVVLAILVSACVALYETIMRLVHPEDLSHLPALAFGGLIGFAGNEIAARIRLRAGHRLESPALVADGNHARVDGFVSLGVVASAILVAAGAPIADPIIGLLITIVILKITWDSWHTVRHTRGAWDTPDTHASETG